MDQSATSAPDFCATPQRATNRLLELFELVPERSPAALRELLDAGANPATRGAGGCTPLHYAAAANDTEIIALLHHYHAPLNAQDDYGNTPLHYAARGRGHDSTRVLLECGANPSLRNKHGETPLIAAAHWPASHYDNEADRFLLSHPLTDVNATNDKYETAFDIAMQQNGSRLASRLAAAGATISTRFADRFSIQSRVRAAQQKWDDFCHAPTRATITLDDLLHFSNLGLLGQALTPSLWQGEEPTLVRLFHSLHPCLQQEALRQSPALTHFFNTTPSSIIHQWTHELGAEPIRGRA